MDWGFRDEHPVVYRVGYVLGLVLVIAGVGLACGFGVGMGLYMTHLCGGLCT
jgi:hypothetical protein